MRAATLLVVLALHAVFFLLFTVVHRREPAGPDAPAMTLILPSEATQPVEPVPPVPAVQAARRTHSNPAPPVSSTPAPQPQSAAINSDAPKPDWPKPDWIAEAQIAANDVLEAERRKREQPSVLAPHDFSAVTPGSTDSSKPEFGWSYAATHRIEGKPGALVLNINDRCAVALVFIFPLAVCKIGRIPANTHLFEHMHEPPAGTISAH